MAEKYEFLNAHSVHLGENSAFVLAIMKTNDRMKVFCVE